MLVFIEFIIFEAFLKRLINSDLCNFEFSRQILHKAGMAMTLIHVHKLCDIDMGDFKINNFLQMYNKLPLLICKIEISH